MSTLRDRLYQFELSPPTGAWNKIAEALDQSHLAEQFPKQLYHSSTTPPAHTWQEITAVLDGKEEQPIVRLPHRSRIIWVRYAAAILLLVIAGWAVFQIAGKKNQGNSSMAGNAGPVNDTSKENSLSDALSALPGAFLGAAVKSSLFGPEIAAATSAPHKKRYVTPVREDGGEPIFAYNEHAPALIADRYVTLMTPNGIVRMSKKLGQWVCCVSGQEQDADCKDQLKKWQQKLAAAPVAPSPANFMDILSLVSALDEEEPN